MSRSDCAFHGLETVVRRFSGATAWRVVHPEHQVIGEHRHDWPCLTLPVLGGYTERFDGTEVQVEGPSAVLHPANRVHANRIHGAGLETLSIQFDPAWLRRIGATFNIDRARAWSGGKIGAAASRLVVAWTEPDASEVDLARATSQFVAFATSTADATRPAWLPRVAMALRSETPPATRAIATELNLHPAWLARAYRRAMGEGTQQTLRRSKVERAVTMLRVTDWELADVAVAAGFCDQSHMNRCIRQMLGRTPLDVRFERNRLPGVGTGQGKPETPGQ